MSTSRSHSPLSVTEQRFKNKESLVSAVQKLAGDELWLDRVNAEKTLSRVSNAKLLRLHTLLEDAKKRFGSRDKLIDSILELENRGKDAGYKGRLADYPLPRLLDLHRALTRRKDREQAKAKAPAKQASAKTAKKAPAKRPSAKKEASAKPAAAKTS